MSDAIETAKQYIIDKNYKKALKLARKDMERRCKRLH